MPLNDLDNAFWVIFFMKFRHKSCVVIYFIRKNGSNILFFPKLQTKNNTIYRKVISTSKTHQKNQEFIHIATNSSKMVNQTKKSKTFLAMSFLNLSKSEKGITDVDSLVLNCLGC